MEKSILIVDDDLFVTMTVGDLLSNQGYRVTTMNSGRRALSALMENSYDLVLTDLVMESIDGLEVLQKTKSNNPEAMVIILTGHGNLSSAIDALRNKADDYLIKPCEPDEILFRVNNCMEKMAFRSKIQKKEMAIRQAKKEWEMTFDAIPDLIMVMDSDNRITRINRAMAEKIGVRPEDVIGRICYELIHDSDTPPDFCPHVQVLTDGVDRTTIGRIEPYNGPFMLTLSPLKDQHNNVIGSIHIARDISRIRETENALRMARLTLDNLPDFIFWVNKAGNIIDANETACRTLGYQRDELLSMTISDIDPYLSSDGFIFQPDEVFTQGFRRRDSTLTSSHGQKIPVEIEARVINFNGNELACIIARGINAKKNRAIKGFGFDKNG